MINVQLLNVIFHSELYKFNGTFIHVICCFTDKLLFLNTVAVVDNYVRNPLFDYKKSAVTDPM